MLKRYSVDDGIWLHVVTWKPNVESPLDDIQIYPPPTFSIRLDTITLVEIIQRSESQLYKDTPFGFCSMIRLTHNHGITEFDLWGCYRNTSSHVPMDSDEFFLYNRNESYELHKQIKDQICVASSLCK